MNKYEEIVAWIEQQVASEQLKTGDKVPSVRLLAAQFQCSKNTVSKALGECKKQHILYAKPKSGYFVVDFHKPVSTDCDVVDFLSAGPDQRIMPYEDFQHCMNQAISHYKEQLFTYSDQQGLYSLRKELTTYLQTLQVFTKPEHLVVTSGSQQALHILSLMPFPNGKKTILIEQPTYFGMIDILQLNSIDAIGIPLTMNGIDMKELERIFRDEDIKFFYIVPRCHNPLGHHYTNSEKKKIVALAKKYNVYIVEDDFLAELDSDLKTDPLFAYEPNGRVIYVKSFSKVFLPGLRIATVVLPTDMIMTFVNYKFSTDFNTPALSQGALEIYLKSGMFSYHLEKVKTLYSNKMKKLVAACALYLPDSVTYTTPKSGFYLTLFMPKSIHVEKFIERLKGRNILVDNASRMYLEKNNKHAIRISISQVNEEKIESGMRGIAWMLEKMFMQRERIDVTFKNEH